MMSSVHDLAEVSRVCHSEAAIKLLDHIRRYVRCYELTIGRKPEIISLDPKQWRTLEILARKLSRTLETCRFAGVPLRLRIEDENLGRIGATD